tara:strand:+ start:427 stop:2931 length:2505 start_codon:yes stop_codon:yes gene_type:complete
LKPLKTFFYHSFLKSGASLLLFVFLTLAGSSQKTIVQGRVMDSETKEPLPFVNVAFKGSKIGASTNMDGYYKIETYYPTDSLVASFVGYKPKVYRVKKDISQTINFNLEAGHITLEAVEIRPDKKAVNPALVILDQVLKNKKINNKTKLDAYQYEAYNKVEFDLNNIDKKFMERKVWKPFKFIFDNVDSTGEKPFLPVFMTESMSDYYYTRLPKRNKEIIKAVKISGIENESIQQFLGDMYQNVNIYDNYVKLFNKSFISPVANLGKASYRYYLLDSADIDDHKCYKIKFIPRRDHELNFAGIMWIADTSYAVKRVEAKASKNANINFVRELAIKQEYSEVENEVWMLTHDYLLVDFNLAETTMGIYGKKTATYRDFKINQPKDASFFAEGTNVVVKDSAGDHSDDYWKENRHIELGKTETQVYHMVDTLNTIPAFRTYLDVIKIITTGYKEFDKFEIGPYFNLYSFNPVEGHRFRLGARTMKSFSEKMRLRGFLAYGTRDTRLKYGAGMDLFVSRKPWSQIHLDYKYDIEQLGTSKSSMSEQNILSSVFRSRPANQLNAVEEYDIGWEHWWRDGFSNEITLRHRQLSSVSDGLKFQEVNNQNQVVDHQFLKFSEIEVAARFGIREKFILGAFDRYSLGTKYPIMGVTGTFGLKGIFESDYEYQKVFVFMSDRIFLNPFGHTDLIVGMGKIWGAVPFPVLELHNGNETFFYDNLAFNLMNFLEYASDEWVEVALTHHFNGIFLNRIPLLRKLQWREVVSVRGVAGKLSPINKQQILFPTTLSELPKPYVEMSVGIENIFKLIRVDGMWRLTNLSKNNKSPVRNFGIAVSLNFTF